MKTILVETGAELLYLCTVLVQHRRYFHAMPVDGIWHLTVPEEALPDLARFHAGDQLRVVEQP